VWAAVDAPADRLADAYVELTGLPGVTWQEVHDVLAAGRTYPAVPEIREAVHEPEKHAAHFLDYPWKPDVVRAYDLGDAYEYWYTFELPAEYDGTQPVGVWFDLGGVLPNRDATTPPGFARAQLTQAFQFARELGGAPVSLTAGWLGQSIVLSVVADMERRFNVDRDRVFLSGYSRMGNATLYSGVHWPDLFAGVCPSSGYYVFDDALMPNLAGVAVLAGRGMDAGHKDANAFMKNLVARLRRGGHTDVRGEVVEGRAVDGALSAACWDFAAQHRREALPRDVQYVLHDERHRGAYWIEIHEVKDRGRTRTVAIRSAGGEETEQFVVNGKFASLHAVAEDENVVRLRAKSVRTARLYLSPKLFDLTRPVVVRFGRREKRFDLVPAIGTLIANFRRDRDRRRLFPAYIDVNL